MAENKRFYRKTDHVCRKCFGRVFKYVDEENQHWVECSSCGLSKKSTHHQSICACGFKLRKKGEHVSKWKNAGFVCRQNPNQTPEMPAQIIVTHEGESHEQEEQAQIC